MTKFILLALSLFLSNLTEAIASEKCTFNNLRLYTITFIFNNNKSYLGKIYLPKVTIKNDEFCGFWNQAKLTNGKNIQYYGYKGETSYISLNPEIYDAGYSIEIIINDEWPQEGRFGKESIAGVIKIGKYIISK